MARRRRSEEYWAERAAAKHMDLAQQGASEITQRLAYAHIRALEALDLEIERLFGRFAEGLAPADARRLLHEQVDNETYEDLMRVFQTAKTPEIKQVAKQALNREPLKYRIHRQEALRQKVSTKMMELADTEIDAVGKWLEEAAKDTMRSGSRSAAQLVGVDMPARPPSAGRIKQMVEAPWSGESFSSRVWHNKEALGVRMNQAIPAGLIEGKSSREIAKDLEDLSDMGIRAAERLVKTETTHVVAEANKASAKERGIKHMKFSAVLDGRTSDACRAMHGKVIPIDELVPGVNQPPLHPHCRSLLMAVNPRMDAIRERLAREKAEQQE